MITVSGTFRVLNNTHTYSTRYRYRHVGYRFVDFGIGFRYSYPILTSSNDRRLDVNIAYQYPISDIKPLRNDDYAHEILAPNYIAIVGYQAF